MNSDISILKNDSELFACWRTGRHIQIEVLSSQQAEYGQEILATPSQELSSMLRGSSGQVVLNSSTAFHTEAYA